jgi:photosystem II stability/assembly factor-like uncharacterized protein/predicted acyltransferase (DUF342 family)
LYTLGRTILQGDVSMNSRLFVNSDVSMNRNIDVTGTLTANLIKLNDGSIVMTKTTPDYLQFITTIFSQATFDANQNWYSVAMSSNGQYQTAVVNGGYIYRSNDYGVTWSQVSSYDPYSIVNFSVQWSSVAMSANGQYQSVGLNSGYSYISNDYGVTWTQGSSITFVCRSIAMSSDGRYQTAVTSSYIYRSTDFGVTWNQATSGSIQNLYSVAMSSDGRYQTAVVNGAYIYRSTDFGVTWTQVGSPQFWCSIAMSSNGQYQFAVVDYGYIYKSGNYGVTWSSVSTNGQQVWRSIATSSDGKYIFAVRNTGFITKSTDTGVTWSETNYGKSWYSIAISADSTYQTALESNGYIYCSRPPITNVIKEGMNLFVSNKSSFGGDVSMSARLFINGDVSMNSRLFISSDVSMNANLYTLGRTILQGDVSMNSRLFVNGDVSMNSRLFINSDVSMNARLFVRGDVSMNANLYTLGRTILQGDVSMNSRLFVNGDVSMNSRLFISSDVSMNARLFVGGDVSMNANLYTLGRTILQGDVSMNSRLFVNGDVSMNSRLFITSDVSMNARLFVGGDASLNARLYVKNDTIINGNIYLLPTSHVYVGDKEIGASTTTETNDTWTLTNLIRAPPAVTFDSGITPLSTTITFAWTYPTQINTGINQYPLPLINSLSIQLKYVNNSSTVGPITIIDNLTTSNYVNTTVATPTSAAITAFVITNSSTVNRYYGSVIVNGSTRYGYTYYNADLVNLINSPSNSLTVWYSNYNTTPNKSSITFTNFLTSGTPGPVQNSGAYLITFSQSNTSNPITITIIYYPPIYSDSGTSTLTLTSAAAPIKDYKIDYSTLGSSLRYDSAVAVSGNSIVTAVSVSSITSDSKQFTNFYPDCDYTFSIVASNKTTNSSYSTSAATATVTTTSLNATSFDTITFPTTSYKKSDGASLVSIDSPTPQSTLTNVYFIANGSIVDWQSNAFNSPINSLAKRGKNGIGTYASLSIAASHNISASYNTTVTYSGFGSSPPTSSSTSGLIITPSTPTDTYSTYSSAYQGFYLQSSNQITIKALALVPSQSQYTLTISQTQAGAISAPSNIFFNYYFDTTAALSVAVPTTAIHTSTTSIQICGIWILYGTVYLTASTTVTNLGNYFYYASKILEYNSGSDTTYEVGLTKISAASKSGGILSSSVTITNSGQAIIYNNANYRNQIPLTTVFAYNPVGTVASNSSSPINAIFDNPTYNLYLSFQNSTSAILSTSAVTGYRVYSGVPQIGTKVPTVLNGGTTRYYNIPFDNTWSLVSATNGGYDGTQELLIAGGAFRTSNPTYKIDYANRKYVSGDAVNPGASQFNYSTMVSTAGTYRYVTFAWKVDTNLSNGKFLNFSLSGQKLYKVNNLLYADNTGTTKILIYYRYEDTAALSTFSSNNSSTYWISANENAADSINNQGVVGGANYFTVGNNLPYYNTPTISISNDTNATITVGPPFTLSQSTTGLPQGNIYVYLRIGLPMNITDVNLTSIKAYFSSA